jgi:hypothetical protein
MWSDLAGSAEPLMILEIDMNAALEWIDAETPHAKVLRHEPVTTLKEFEGDADVRAAIERIEAFQARITREALAQPLVVVEPA